TLGPPSQGCMQTPRSPPIASSGGADRRENGGNAELAPLRENSAADHPLRQENAPARVRWLDAKGFMPQWPPTLRVGRSEVSSKIRPDSNFWGSGLFFVGFICIRRRK